MTLRDYLTDVSAHSAVRTDPSPRESARFGLRVERLNVKDGSPAAFEAVRDAVRVSEADVVIMRYPAECVGWFARLRALGWDALIADSLVYWRLSVGRRPLPESRPGVWLAEVRDPVVVEKLVGEIFPVYDSHYLANPLFDAGLAMAGYREWSCALAVKGQFSGLYMAERDEPELVAFMALQDEGPVTEFLLGGVAPWARGRRVHDRLLIELERRAVAMGATEVLTVTQSHNALIQKGWARQGYEPLRAFLTVHLVRKGLLPEDGG
jgi:hypothetical protein